MLIKAWNAWGFIFISHEEAGTALRQMVKKVKFDAADETTDDELDVLSSPGERACEVDNFIGRLFTGDDRELGKRTKRWRTLLSVQDIYFATLQPFESVILLRSS